MRKGLWHRTRLSCGVRGRGGKCPRTLTEQRLDRLAGKLKFDRGDLELLLLAGMPEEHEGYAAVFRTLHPRGEPRPSVGLAAQVLGGGSRAAFLERFGARAVIRSGAVKTTGEVPFFEKSLDPADSLWPVLHGGDEWPSSLTHCETPPVFHGLDDWLATRTVGRACHALRQAQPCTVVLSADFEDTAFHRGLAMVRAAGRQPVGFPLSGPMEPGALRLLKMHALARGWFPSLRLASPEGQVRPTRRPSMAIPIPS